MKDFAANIWNDLREKRLWPVAVLLLVALVAVPVVLAKSSETPPAPAAPQAQNPPADEPDTALAGVELVDGEVGSGSSLDTFDPSNPFSPPARVVEEAEEQLDDLTVGGSGADVAAPVVDDTVSVDVEEPSSGGGGTGTDGGGGGGDTGGDEGGDKEKTQTTEYAYVLDVTFVKNTRKRRIKGLQKLEMLPNEASPLLIYMGVTENAGNAVFMVDATLQTTGEGSCKPTGDDCAFLHIGAGSEQMFTDEEGNSYRLKIDQIRRVKVGGDGSTSPSRKKAKRRPRASAAVGAPRRFVIPVLADLVSVSTAPGDASGTGGRGR